MAVLPAQPDLDHLRHEAKDLLRAARGGDAAAAGRISEVSDRLTLAAAQRAVAGEYGFASWAKLKVEVQARADDLARLADEFCRASIGDWTGRAVKMLAARPELASYNLATAIVLGDAERVRTAIGADPSLATIVDPRTGWTALHAACASRWHQLDPARSDGLLAVATLLLDAGADPSGRTAPDLQWTPLLCAVAGAPNPAITRLLLERGAMPADSQLYLAGFEPDHHCLRLLLEHAPDVRAIARQAMAAPLSGKDTEGVRMLLEAGADPGQYHNDDDEPFPVIYAAVQSDCGTDLLEVLLQHGAEPALHGPDGRSPMALATSMGRTDLTELLRRHGAADDSSDVDVLLSACLRADRAAAERLVDSQPDLPGGVADGLQAATMARAAETGSIDAVRLMLDIGFQVSAQGGDLGGTALHAAAFAGSAAVAELLIERGADLEARDRHWNDTPVGWSVVGSGMRPTENPAPDWLATIGALIGAGASLDGITLGPDDEKPPSAEVADLLRQHGVGQAR
jgi:Ankyrin repeats (3 copies)/Ankyrin repeat